jgi:hypothetical protein
MVKKNQYKFYRFMPVNLQTQEQFKKVLQESPTQESEGMTNQAIEKELSSLQRMHEAESLLTHAKSARRKYDREWLTRDLFRRGYQFASQDPSTGSVTITSATKARIPINLTWAYMRAIKNQVTSFNPKWEVLPDFKGAKSEQNARLAGKLLDALYKKMNLNKLIKEAVIQGLQFSVGGPFEVYWDPNYDNGPNNPRGEVVITLHDPFDVYVDPKATSLEDAEYVVKCVRTPISEIKNNPEYGPIREQLVGGTAQLAESEYKQFLLQTIYNTQSATSENETVILKEIQKKERDESGNIKIRIITWCDGVTRALRDIVLDKEEFDMESYQADVNPLEFYGPSWMKNVMPLNKALNALESSVFEYSYRFAKGRMVIDKNAGVDIVTNEHGSIIEKERGSEVTTLPIAPLPSDITNQIIRLRAIMEDISGVHEATLGRVPGSVKSGIGIAELKQSDACVDTSVEALTRNGWKKFDELKTGEEIYLMDPETRTGKWGKLKGLHIYDKEEEDVYKFETRNFECIATSNHKWLIHTANDFWHVKETKDLKNDNYIPLVAESSDRPTVKKYSDEFVELVGWVLTEGTYSRTKTIRDRGGVDIRIYQMDHQEYEVKRIRETFKKLGITRKPYLDNRGCWQFTFAKEEARIIRKLFPNKSLTIDFVNDLTKDQLKLLIDVMVLADGSERENGRQCFINTKKEMVDAFQLACTYLGISTSISKHDDGDDKHALRYTVNLKTTEHISVGHLKNIGQMETVKYTGKVWCPETETGYWLARKNGKLFYTGNSNQDDLVQNLEHCLRRLGRKILKIISENYTTPRVTKVVGTGRMIEHFAVVGRDYVSDDKTTWKIGNEEYPLAKIGVGNEIQVQIGSWLAYSKEARQQKILDLAKAGILSKEDVLRYYEFPNVQDAIDRVRAEQIVELKRKESQEMPSGISQEQLALAENEMLSEGLPAPVDPIEDDHELHIAVHMTQAGQGRKSQLVASHIQEHRRSQKGGGSPIGLEQMRQPQRVPLPPPQGGSPQGPPQQGGVPLAEQRVPVPPVTQLSAGVVELPPTAGSIVGGPTNPIPVR